MGVITEGMPSVTRTCQALMGYFNSYFNTLMGYFNTSHWMDAWRHDWDEYWVADTTNEVLTICNVGKQK